MMELFDRPKVYDDLGMTEDSAHIVFTRVAREKLRDPIIYAAFDDEGKCRYVGKSINGIARPLAPRHHRLDGLAWTRLLIWRVDIETDEELDALEGLAIRRFRPDLNRAMPQQVPKASPKSLERLRRAGLTVYKRPAECAAELGVDTRYITGEIRDGRLPAIMIGRGEQRRAYRVPEDEWLIYKAKYWAHKAERSA